VDNQISKAKSIIRISFIAVIAILIMELFYVSTIFVNRDIQYMKFIVVKKIQREVKQEIIPVETEEDDAKTISLKASWYKNDCCGKSTCIMANGDVFDDSLMTAAFNLVPLGEIVKVKYGDKVIHVEITDRISKKYSKSRIDLSKGAFEELEHIGKGLIDVEVIRY